MDGNRRNEKEVSPLHIAFYARRIDVSSNRLTLSLLQKIAAANGTDIDAFLGPCRRPDRDAKSQRRGVCERTAMLLRVVRAYHALPGFESRRHALRMMEAMAERAKGMQGGEGR